MSSKDLKQLALCMDQLAYLFEELGISEAAFSNGKASFKHSGMHVNETLMSALCQHISDIQRDELAKGEEELPDYYFD